MRFIVEYNIWEKKEIFENIRKTVAKFERRLNAKVRRQEKLNMVKK